jgi:hypothetical protein
MPVTLKVPVTEKICRPCLDLKHGLTNKLATFSYDGLWFKVNEALAGLSGTYKTVLDWKINGCSLSSFGFAFIFLDFFFLFLFCELTPMSIWNIETDRPLINAFNPMKSEFNRNKNITVFWDDRLCGLLVRVSGYRSRGPRFDSRLSHIFWEIVRLERGPLSLVRITEELLERKVTTPVKKTEINGREDSLRWPRYTLYPLKLALTSPPSGGRSAGIVRWRTKAPEFVFGVFWDMTPFNLTDIYQHFVWRHCPHFEGIRDAG